MHAVNKTSLASSLTAGATEPQRQAAHLKHRNLVLAVDLVGRRVKPAALLHVLVEDAAALHVTETKLTQVELWKSGEHRGQEKKSLNIADYTSFIHRSTFEKTNVPAVLLWVRGRIPRLDFKLAKLDD